MPDYSSFPVTNGVITYLAPPENYDVDFDNPQRQYHMTLYLVVGIGNFLTLLFMYQRLYTKIFLVKGLQIEDGTSSSPRHIFWRLLTLFLWQVSSLHHG